MGRVYINSDEVKITRGSAYTVDAEFYSGQRFEGLGPRCLFPISGPDRYISLLNEKNEEIAVIRNVNNLMPDSKKVIKEVLYNYYLIPKITAVLDRSEKYGILRWKVETDRGVREIEITHRQSDVKVIYQKRVLIKDSNDNRYEIPDYDALDARSLKKILADI